MSPGLLRMLRPFFRFSAARGAWVLRLGGGQYGPVLVNRQLEDSGMAPAQDATQPTATGRFQRTDGGDVADGPEVGSVTRTRQR